MEKHKCILAVAPHPDDLDFGCPITLKNFIKQGYDVYYVIITNGENGSKDKKLTKDQRIKIRREEQMQAAAKVGAKKVYFWGYRDGFLEYKEELRKKLTLLIKALKPELVFSFDPANRAFDNINLFHRDHRIAAELCYDSVFAAKNDYIYPHKNGPHRVDRIFFFGTDKPNYFVDITDEIDFKLDVLSSYSSQFPNFENFSKFYKENFDNHTKKYKYSEAFRVMDVVQVSY